MSQNLRGLWRGAIVSRRLSGPPVKSLMGTIPGTNSQGVLARGWVLLLQSLASIVMLFTDDRISGSTIINLKFLKF